MTGDELVSAERRRQLDEKGYTAAQDDTYTRLELVRGAKCYLEMASLPAWMIETPGGFECAVENQRAVWPWPPSSFKPSTDPIRNLAKASAMLAAEIDRLQRQGSR